MLKKKGNIGIFGRFIAIFMTAVLFVTVMPIEVQAASYHYRIYFQDQTATNVDIFQNYFYFKDITNNKIYNFERESEFTVVVKNISGPIQYEIYSEDGILQNSGKLDRSTLYYTRVSTVNFCDGADILELKYLIGFTRVLEQNVSIPRKEGYTFNKWIDAQGDDVIFPLHAGYGGVMLHGETYNVYADWKVHEHVWDEQKWNYDEDAHWHECIVLDCPITENSEKEGYNEHEYNGRNEVVKEAKCYQKGLEYVYCAIDGCGAYEEREVDMLSHDYEEEWRYDSIIHYHKCKNCNDVKDEDNHQMGQWSVVNEAKFSEDGLKERKCQACEYKEEEIITKLSEGHIHDFNGKTELVREPKCYEKGLEYVYCTLDECGAYEEHEMEMLSHDMEEAWRFDDVVHYHKCKNCNHCEDIDNHHLTEWNEVTAVAFSTDGLEERHCLECEYNEERVTQKLSNTHIHEYKGYEEIINQPTCTKEGIKKVYCTEKECGAFIEKAIPMVEHDMEIGWFYDKDIHYHKCKNCGIHGEDDGPHHMVETNMVKLATENSPGIMELECVRCGYVDYEEMPYEVPPVEDNEGEQDKFAEESPFTVPQTDDVKIVHIYATLAMISGMTYLLYYFRPINMGISKERKEELVDKLIKWAKSRNRIVKLIALIGITIILFYYHATVKITKVEETTSHGANTL